jgi:hypothetical protein
MASTNFYTMNPNHPLPHHLAGRQPCLDTIFMSANSLLPHEHAAPVTEIDVPLIRHQSYRFFSQTSTQNPKTTKTPFKILVLQSAVYSFPSQTHPPGPSWIKKQIETKRKRKKKNPTAWLAQMTIFPPPSSQEKLSCPLFTWKLIQILTLLLLIPPPMISIPLYLPTLLVCAMPPNFISLLPFSFLPIFLSARRAYIASSSGL